MVSTNLDDTAPKKKLCIACKQEFSGDEVTCPNDGTTLTSLTMETSIGSTIGDKYEILAVIGGGAMGLVYKARHMLMKRVVAVKMLHPNMLPDAGTIMRFKKEAEALSCLNHPNILTVFDFGISTQGQPYLVTDYLEGQTLGELLEQNQSIPWKRTAAIFMQVCSALSHAHKNGVIHRDIKPSNIMLTEFEDQADFVKILDFGIAKVITEQSEDSSQLTRTGEVFGSPLYMSPEQCRGKPLDAKSDIYSLGCVLFRTLTGQPAFFGQDLVECLYKHVNEQAPRMAEIAPEIEIPAEFEAIVQKCLAKDPAERFQTMVELKESLGSVLGITPANPTDYSLLKPVPTQTAPALDKSSGTLPAANVSAEITKSPADAATSATASSKALESTNPDPAAVTPIVESVQAQAPAVSTPAPAQNATAAKGSLFQDKKAVIAGVVLIALLMVIPLVSNKSNNDQNTGTKEPVSTPGTAAIPSETVADTYDSLMENAIEEYEIGEYDLAQEKLNKAIRAGQREKVSPEKIANAQHYMVAACLAADEDTEAEAFTSEIEHSAKVTGPGPVPTTMMAAEAYFDRASILIAEHRSDKDLDKARAYLTQSLKYLKTRSDAGNETMRTLSKLGQVELMDGNLDKAETLLKEAVAIAEKDPNVRQLDLAVRMDLMADTYVFIGKEVKSDKDRDDLFTEAQNLYMRALQLRITNLKSHDHPALAQSYQRIGIINFLQGNYDKALTELEKALEIRQKRNKPLQLSETLRAISYVYLRQKDFTKAESTFHQAIATAKKAGPDANVEIKKWQKGFNGLKAECQKRH